MNCLCRSMDACAKAPRAAGFGVLRVESSGPGVDCKDNCELDLSAKPDSLVRPVPSSSPYVRIGGVGKALEGSEAGAFWVWRC